MEAPWSLIPDAGPRKPQLRVSNLFPLDGKWVLIVSPNRPCEYWIGDLDVERVQFTPQAHGVLDAGDAYASKISVDDRGRTILWLWGRTNTPQANGWGSVITMPRILSLVLMVIYCRNRRQSSRACGVLLQLPLQHH